MIDTMMFIKQHMLFSFGLLILNIIIVWPLALKIAFYTNRYALESVIWLKKDKSLFNNIKKKLKQNIAKFERGEHKSDYYNKTKDKLRKAGYKGEYAVLIYITLKFIVPALMFFLTLYIRDIFRAALIAILIVLFVELRLRSSTKNLELKFTRHVYKIYKYLHNQISSGTKVTDAIKSVYMIIDDDDIRTVLMIVAAKYELTNDIDSALKELLSYYDNDEAQTLCIALKQGILTGDNQNLLERQERKMFNKYFAYIQAETDSCKLRSLLVVSIFAFILIIMIGIPLINDVKEALEVIFVN